MSEFRYVALSADGSTLHGNITAENREEAVRKIERDGFYPVRVEDADQASPPASPGFLLRLLTFSIQRKKGLRQGEILEFTQELALMLEAAHDLDRTLRYIVDVTTRAEAREIITNIRDRIREGGSLANALALYPESFSKLYIGLVRAGEASGALASVLVDLARYLENRGRQIAEIRSAMIYPALLAIASIGAVVFLLTMILPQFETLFSENGAQMPLVTRIVIAAGHGCSQYGPFLLAGCIVFYGMARVTLRSPDMRRRVDSIRLKLPVFGKLERTIIADRVSRTLGTLMRNGVPLVRALRITVDVAGNEKARTALETVLISAKEGGGLHRALGRTGVFPRRMVDLVQLGEETARLPELLLKSADIHEGQARATLSGLVTLLVPAITILMGGIVAFIVTALLMAMLSLNDLAA